MPALALLFAAAALTVKQDGAELREACEPGDPVVARLPAGAAAKIRFGINGCYAVDVSHDGKVLHGYLPRGVLAGIEDWELARRSAASIEIGASAPVVPKTGVENSPWHLIRLNRPSDALAAAERLLLAAPRDPNILGIAGIAAYRNDMGPLAIGYLKDAVALRPDSAIQALLDQALREQKSDRTGEPLHSTRFQFRFDPAIMSRDTARALLALLESEFSRISFELGCATAQPIAVIAQTRDDYLKATGAAEWSAGQFDGRIRVAVLTNDPGGAETRRALAHEAVHACLAGIGQLPAWLHEGLAQKLSGETLSEPRRAAIQAVAKRDGLPPLAGLSASWSRLTSGHAAIAYAISLYAVELFYRHHAEFGIRNLLRNPDQMERVMTDLDRRLRE